MAFTIHQQPQEYTPGYNTQAFVVSSSNSAQPNFRYIAKYYIGSDVITEKTLPHPIYGSCYFNPARISESLLSFDIDKNVYGYATCENSIASYYVEFYEEYDIAGVLTVSSLLDTSDIIKIWNGVTRPLYFYNYDFDNYDVAQGAGILNHNLDRSIRLSDSYWFYYLTSDVTVNTTAVTVSAYDYAGGSLLNSVILNNPFQNNANIGEHFIRCDMGPKGLNSIPGGGVTAILQPIIPTTCTYYEVEFDFPTNIVLKFNVAGEDCRYETFRLHYQNELGAFESFNFTKASNHSEEIKKEKYKSIVGGLSSSTTYGYRRSDRSVKTLQTTTKDKYKIRTNWLTEEYKTILGQLVASPVVYWDTDGTKEGLVSIDILNSSYEYDKKVNKKNFFLEIDFEIGFENERQRY